jgi:hypothetical protein
VEGEIEGRIRRVCAALGASVEKDMTKLPAVVRKTRQGIVFWQDFSGGQSGADLENLAHFLVYNIAHLRDHLRSWATSNQRNPGKVAETITQCPALQVICDLSNTDKHGGYDAEGRRTWSGKKLRLANVKRHLELKPGPVERSSAVVMLGRVPIVSGDGTVNAVVTGDVLEESGSWVGDLHETACGAVAAWEALLKQWRTERYDGA